MRVTLRARDQPAILAGDADRHGAGAGDRLGDLLVDRAGEDHLDHVEHRLVGHPQALDEGGLHVQALEHGVDLRPAAMDHHRVDADLLQQRDVAAEAQRGLLLAHGVAAILHHDDLVVVALQEGQRAGEDLHRVGRGVGHRPVFRNAGARAVEQIGAAGNRRTRLRLS